MECSKFVLMLAIGCGMLAPNGGRTFPDEPKEDLREAVSEALQRNDLARAIRLCTQGLQTDPNADDFALTRAACLIASQKPFDALRDFENVISHDAKSAMAHNGKGGCLLHLLRPTEALREFSAAIELSPTKAMYYRNRAEAYQQLKMLDRSEADCDMAVRLDPANVELIALRAEVRGKLKKFDEALNDCKHAETLGSTVRLLQVRGHIFVAQNKLEEAETDFKKALAINPKSLAIVYEMALLEEKKQRYAAAKAYFERAVELAPNQGITLGGLARFLSDCPNADFRNEEEAKRLATRACELSEWKSPGSISTLAMIHARKGDFATAIKLQEKLLRLPKDSFFGNYSVAEKELQAFKTGTLPSDK
ncbi:hypothetical protein BH10PLA2_BH10PLA2_15610 [soil metagenome]